MTEVEELKQAILHGLPGASVSLDGKVQGDRFAWLDIHYGGRSVVVEWRESQGFGVSLLPRNPEDPFEGLFQGPDEIFNHWDEARDHVLLLLAESSVQRRPKRVARA